MGEPVTEAFGDCVRCGKQVTMKSLTVPHHRNCFKCGRCREYINPVSGYYEFDGSLFHEACAEEEERESEQQQNPPTKDEHYVEEAGAAPDAIAHSGSFNSSSDSSLDALLKRDWTPYAGQVIYVDDHGKVLKKGDPARDGAWRFQITKHGKIILPWGPAPPQ
eukprot:TRINITY_DN114825_c0_g1_i1.p1 TRINITY_DN114825_c0_g1~~TRINITY_DN114825_c0_g1_i1.p1  ORF type:complete len:163 (-),score=20.11 TRINITY_DN114825_c0_g1_i1:171-659(-)